MFYLWSFSSSGLLFYFKYFKPNNMYKSNFCDIIHFYILIATHYNVAWCIFISISIISTFLCVDYFNLIHAYIFFRSPSPKRSKHHKSKDKKKKEKAKKCRRSSSASSGSDASHDRWSLMLLMTGEVRCFSWQVKSDASHDRWSLMLLMTGEVWCFSWQVQSEASHDRWSLKLPMISEFWCFSW